MDQKTMFKLSYGLFVLTTRLDGKDNGCIINTAIQVASDPDTISISVNKRNYSHDLLLTADDFTVSVLSEQADFELIKQFGFQSGRTSDKFTNFTDVMRVQNGTLAVTCGTNAYLSAKIIKRCDLGSHTLFVAQITDAEILSSTASATYTYYQEHIKPKPQQQMENGKTVWRCTVCGYEWEGEQLPEDFTCPICKHPASDFLQS